MAPRAESRGPLAYCRHPLQPAPRRAGLASIFLSYSREDAARAKTLAKALERAGHNVWWDRHIGGGAEFSGEIEAALGRADIVLVLWSDAAVRSAWVRDEAAEGRDSGRLLPVQLDGTPPPLGFRQLQAISLAGWSGRGSPPHLADILRAIDQRSGKAPPAADRASPLPTRRWSLSALASLVAILLVVVVVGRFLTSGDPAEAKSPVIAVMPFSDLSPSGDRAYLAEGVAEAILTVLAKERGIKILGRSSARQLQDAGAQAPAMREAMGITHILEGSARSAGEQLRMSVRLVDASSGSQIWAEEYQRRLDNIFAVQDEIGRAVATKLRGSFDGAASSTPITKADNYALYLAARSRIRDRRGSSLREALQLTKRVIAADPNYAPAHALYAEILNHLSVDNYGTIPDREARRLGERHARKAIALAPDLGDGYAALGVILENEAAIEPLKKAISLDPARAELRNWLGHALNAIGRPQEAFAQFRAALEMEPLWGPGISMVAYMLAASERFDEAEAEVARYRRRGGKASVANKIRGDIAQYRGDYSEGARLNDLAMRQDPETPQADLSAGWYYFMLGMHDDAVRVSGRLPRNLRLMFAGQEERLRQEARAAGAGIFKQLYPESSINALASAGDWKAITALYDANRAWGGKVCRNPEKLTTALQFAAALKYERRQRDLAAILSCVRRTLRLHTPGPIFTPYLPAGAADLSWAQIHAIEGDAEQAFRRLDRSIDRGVRIRFGRGIDSIEGFETLKSHPAYRRIDNRLRRLIAQDRAEALAWKRRAA